MTRQGAIIWRAVEEFEAAAREDSWAGTKRPEEHEAIEQRYEQAKATLKALIEDLTK